MGVASCMWSQSVQSVSLQACLSTTHLDGHIRTSVCPLSPPSNEATKETIIEKKSILSKR